MTRAIRKASLEAENAHLKQVLLKLESELAHQKALAEKYRCLFFGQKSERFTASIDQLELALGVLTQASEPPLAPSSPGATSKRHPVRRPPPPHLPRERREHLPEACQCPDCGGKLVKLGEDISEMLEYVPACFKVIQHVRPKFACADCDKIVQAAAPARPLTRAIPGPALLAHILTAKYCDHLPLNRQAMIFARAGIDLDKSTMGGWVKQSAQLLKPLVETIRRHVLAAEKIHADDTTIRVLEPGAGKTRTGRFWAYVRDDRPSGDEIPAAVWFAYSPNRRAAHPTAHLKHYRGIVQTDGYSGYNEAEARSELTRAGCMAHVRRKFDDLLKSSREGSPLATEALLRIRHLYAIERDIRGQSPPARQAARQSRAGPLLAEFRTWLDAQAQRVSRHSVAGEAIRYALNQWPLLVRYIEDGRIEIDNNPVERAIRPIAMGRAAYLFAGSDEGAQSAAVLYTLIGTAKLNGLDPEAYLRDVLDVIGEHPVNRLDALLPWNRAPRDPAREAA